MVDKSREFSLTGSLVRHNILFLFFFCLGGGPSRVPQISNLDFLDFVIYKRVSFLSFSNLKLSDRMGKKYNTNFIKGPNLCCICFQLLISLIGLIIHISLADPPMGYMVIFIVFLGSALICLSLGFCLPTATNSFLFTYTRAPPEDDEETPPP